ncbi:hypothetical protein JXZ92_02610 [Mycoplasma sp. CSL10137]|uniref:hypothetical protein n=1 Tax=Mycoplasma sp. CSL10137 TaxID=2813824 RepID=UPI00197BED48|nr:hypothetical protein [Mycoplasma sp. CSL10137]MBN4083701.1 hypothetical protein [Mycoplasma sp. CSL10137]
MKKRNKWLILGSLTISFGSLPVLIACSNNVKTRKPIPKNNSKIDEQNISNNNKTNEKAKKDNIVVSQTQNNKNKESNIINKPNNVENNDQTDVKNENDIEKNKKIDNVDSNKKQDNENKENESQNNKEKDNSSINKNNTITIDNDENIDNQAETSEHKNQEQNVSSNAKPANKNIDSTNNTHIFNNNFSLREEYILKEKVNVKDISNYHENDQYFDVYNNWLKTKTSNNNTNIVFDDSHFIEFSLLSYVYANNSLTIKIKSNFDLDEINNYKLIYRSDVANENIEVSLSPFENSKRTLLANISNITQNYKIKLVDIKKNNESLNFLSKGEIMLGNESWEESRNFIISNDNEWKTWPAVGNRHSFKIVFRSKYNGATPYVPNNLRFIWLTKDKRIEYARFSYKKVDDWNNIKTSGYTKLIAESETFDISNIDKILGIEINPKTGNQDKWLKINGIPEIKITGKEDENSSQISNAPIINSTTLQNNSVIIDFRHLDQSLVDTSKVQFEVKSMDPFNKFSNVFLGYKSNDNQYTIQDVNLPKDISQFMITRVNFGNQLYDYNINSRESIIKNHPITKNFKVERLNFYTDNETKNIYGSIGINFSKEDLELFKNKNLELTFQRKDRVPGEDSYGGIYYNLFLKEEKIVVPFDKLQKFNLNGFYENTKYELEKIGIVDKYSLIEFVGNQHFAFSLDLENNKSFLYNFEYSNFDNNYIAGSNSGETKNSLMKKVSNTDLNIDYSIQNHYSLNNYNRELWYKQRASLFEDEISPELSTKKEYLKNHASKIHLTQHNKEIKTHFISPREVINDLSWKINDNFTLASITKDLSNFDGIDNHQKDAYFEIGFEFDPKQRQLIDLIEPEPFVRYGSWTYNSSHSTKNMSKSFVYISVPYSQILENNEISDLGFEYLAIRNSKEEELKLKQLIANRYKFNVKYNKNTKELTYIIESRDKSNKIVDRLGDHYFSLHNSAFLGNSLFFVHWADLDENNITNITYMPKSKKGILSIGLDQLNFEDSYDYVSTTIWGSSKRVYFNNTEENVLNARDRVFNFAPRPKGAEGTWDVIGKVNPNDPNDYRFFVTTNQHVWGSAYSREFKNNNFNLPIKLFEPKGGWTPDSRDTRGRIENEKEWSEATVKVELIANFHNDITFPNTATEFKNNYADINENSTWHIFGENKTEHSLSNADLVVGIADFKDFYSIFNEKDGKMFYNGQEFNENNEAIYRTYMFFKKLPTLKTIKPSKHNLHLSKLVNLNWSIASFPIKEQTYNKDSLNNKRYREYIIGSMGDYFIEGLAYGGARSKLPAIPLDSTIFDLQGGSSGSMAFDSEGNATGLLTESTFSRSNVMLIDTNGNAFLGDGKTTQNPASFYERMRLLSYLFPNKYNHNQFNEKPNWEKINNE